MKLNNDLITQFAKITKIDNKSNDTTTVRGVARTSDGKTYIQFDGADEGSMTPVDTTVEVSDGDRVIATIKNHNAIITGNTTDPAVGVKTANGLSSKIEQTAEKIRTEVTDEVNKLNSTIEQTAGKIKAEVVDGVKGWQSTIEQTAGNLTSRVEKAEGEVKTYSEFKQTVEGFYFKDTDGTVYIDGGDVYAKNLKLTGSISWSDLNSVAQGKVTDAQDAAENAQTDADAAKAAADEAMKVANEAHELAEGVSIPAYIKSTYIDSTTVKSPTIIGGKMYAVGSNPNNTSTFSVMDEDGFYIYYDTDTGESDDDSSRILPKMSLTTLSNGNDIRLVLGAGGGSDSNSEIWYNRFYISKRSEEVDIAYVYNWDYDSVGIKFKLNEDKVYIDGELAGVNGLFPVGYIYMSFDDQTSPAELFGGSWKRIEGYFLYAGTELAEMYDTGNVVTSGGTGTAEYIKIAAWERTA